MYMKTNKTIAFLALLMASITSFSQERGFFRIYPFEGCSSPIPLPLMMTAIEAQDGDAIVAINNMQGGPSEPWGRLFRLSADGELTNSVPFGDGNSFHSIFNLFRHPQEPDTYIGAGQNYTLYQTTPYNIYQSAPYFVHFDNDLDISLQQLAEWPEAYQYANSASNARYTLSYDGKVFGVFGFELPSDTVIHYRHRLYALMSLEGDFEHVNEDTTSYNEFGAVGGTEAVFEFPGSWQKGVLHETLKLVQGDHYQNVHGLYRLNKNLEETIINDYFCIYSDTIVNNYQRESYSLTLTEPVSTPVLPLDDTTLLFSTRGDELLNRFINDTNYLLYDHAPVLFKTNMEGDIWQLSILGRMNDTLESTPYTSVALTEPDVNGHRNIYHCCYSRDEYYMELPNLITVTKLTDDFDVLWRKTYSQTDTYLEPYRLIATADGGCLVVGLVSAGDLPYNATYNWFALKLEPDGTVGTNNITVTNELSFYPNPTKDMLHLTIPTNIKPTNIEFYDLQGRLVRTQSKELESLSLQGLSAGTYTMRVTLEDGKVFSDKVVKE